MDDDVIIQRISLFLNEYFGAGVRDPDDDLLMMGVVDSLRVVEIAAFLESAFEISLDENALQRTELCSVRAMAKLVRSKLGVT
jgi:acyl carrier protein